MTSAINASAYDWEARTQAYLAGKTGQYNNQTSAYIDDGSVFNEQGAAVSQETGNTCTDGKDDGKVGFFGAIGSAIKGIGKGIVNGVKGMFTGKDGKFSLGKTLLSIGTVALCVACPAVGAVACGIGVVAGGAKVIGGAVKAANAKTDAEAKDAWENMGDGAFTAVASAYGAKASIGAMKSAASASKAGSALSSLDDTATIGQKISAFGKDAVNSTKYNLSKVKAGATNKLNVAKEVADIKKLEAKVSKIDGAKSADDLAMIRELDARKAFMSDEAKAALNTIDDATAAASKAKTGFGKTVKTKAHDVAASAKEAAKHPFTTAKNAAKGTINKLRSISPKNLATKIKNLPAKSKEILTKLNNKGHSYDSVVQEYGWESVNQALTAFAGYQKTTTTV